MMRQPLGYFLRSRCLPWGEMATLPASWARSRLPGPALGWMVLSPGCSVAAGGTLLLLHPQTRSSIAPAPASARGGGLGTELPGSAGLVPTQGKVWGCPAAAGGRPSCCSPLSWGNQTLPRKCWKEPSGAGRWLTAAVLAQARVPYKAGCYGNSQTSASEQEEGVGGAGGKEMSTEVSSRAILRAAAGGEGWCRGERGNAGWGQWGFSTQTPNIEVSFGEMLAWL